MELTEAKLRAFAPRGRDDYIQGLLDMQDVLDLHGILASPIRWCHFIGQWGHETGGLTIVQENMAYTASNLLSVWPNRYPSNPAGKAKAALHAKLGGKFVANYNYGGRLGNRGTATNDGWDYRGRGFVQMTGRENYAWHASELNIDLLAHPELAERADVGIKAACMIWDKHGLNRFADIDQTVPICKAINCGAPYATIIPNGLDDRRLKTSRAWALWGQGVRPSPPPGVLLPGMQSDEVAGLQRRLKALGYHSVGAADTIFGRETARALAAFKADWRADGGFPLEPGDVVGAHTAAALDQARPVERVARAARSAQEVAKADPVAQTANRGSVAAVVAGAAAVTQAAPALTTTDELKQVAEQVTIGKTIIAPVIDTVSWAQARILPVALVALALGAWVYFRRIRKQQVERARSGELM